ncbi:MAG: alcohol dehydrogenase catalytic domain-containing protein [Verrucomicrobiota bacterium]
MQSTESFVLYGPNDLRKEERSLPERAGDDVLIEVNRVGVCGSDVHYVQHGRCGVFNPSRPFVLGHEFAGTAVEGPEDLVGRRVAVMPLLYCGSCRFCLAGRTNICPNSHFLGSARRSPTDGGFSRYVIAPARNCYLMPENLSFEVAALLEPLSVAMHAVNRAGPIQHRKVLVTGGGPIGQLIAMVVRHAGAGLTALSDIEEKPLAFAREQGIDLVLNPRDEAMSEQVDSATGGIGFDIVFEASGAEAALVQGIESTARGGTIVQVGTMPDQVSLPANLIMTRELNLVGTFGFADVFQDALDLAASGRLNLEPLISRTYPFEELIDAVEAARVNKEMIKVQVAVA